MSANASSNSSLRPTLASITAHDCPALFVIFFNGLVLLLLFVLILVLDCRQRRTQGRMSAAAVRHVEVVYHSMAIQLEELSGIGLYFIASYTGATHLIWLATNIIGISSHGQLLLHFLTCVERYIAVVHPVFFMRLRKTGEVKVQRMWLCCVWLLGFAGTAALYFSRSSTFMLVYVFSTMLLLIVLSLCSVSVLRALMRPRPGEGADGRTRRVDRSKLRAFHTILTILAVLLFKLLGMVSCAVVFNKAGKYFAAYVSVTVVAWFDAPSNMVLPVLYLHRTRRQQKRKKQELNLELKPGPG